MSHRLVCVRVCVCVGGGVRWIQLVSHRLVGGVRWVGRALVSHRYVGGVRWVGTARVSHKFVCVRVCVCVCVWGGG